MESCEIVRRLFLDTLEQLEVSKVMHRQVFCSAGTIHAGKNLYVLAHFRRFKVVSVGKAAVPMAMALLEIVKPHLAIDQHLDGIVVGTTSCDVSEFRSFLGGHPIPDEESLKAGTAVLEYLADCDEETLIFCLISGGASAMLEQPLDRSMTITEVTAFHQALVHSGLAIQEMNALRKHFSAVKGGRLAIAAGAATVCTLLISDVPGALLHIVGSGPTLPDPSTVADCREILERNLHALQLPERVMRFFMVDAPETPKPGDDAFQTCSSLMLLSSEDLCLETARLASQRGFHVVVDNSCDEWLYNDAADYLLRQLAKLHEQHGRTCLISAGEVSVKVTQGHGVGGRNQHFVLECARRLALNHQRATILSAGTDGIDGNSLAAGGVADETTVHRTAEMGLSIVDALEQFDSYTILDALGDTLVTGPSGNNIRDLRILLSAD